MLDVRGFAVFVRTQEGDIEAIARILEVVRIAAEERCGVFRREDDADVGVALVAIEVIERAAVEGDDVAVIAGFLERLSLDVREDRVSRLHRFVGRQLRIDGRVHARRDILDRNQHVDFLAGELHLISARFREKSAGNIILPLARDVLQPIDRDVMVRQDQPIR